MTLNQKPAYYSLNESLIVLPACKRRVPTQLQAEQNQKLRSNLTISCELSVFMFDYNQNSRQIYSKLVV